MSEKARESRLRRKLKQHGQLLKKSRKSISADNLGDYMIVDGQTGAVVRGQRFEYTLDDVEQYLNE